MFKRLQRLLDRERGLTAFALSSLYLRGTTLLGGMAALRWIEPDEIGVWQTLLLWQTYLTVLRVGIPSAFNRELPRRLGAEDTDGAVRGAKVALAHTALLAVLSLLFFIGVAVVSGGTREEWLYGGLTFAVTTGLQAYWSYGGTVLRAHDRFRTLGVIQATDGSLAILLPFWVYTFGFVGFCIHALLRGVVLAVLYYRALPMRETPQVLVGELKMLLRVGFPLFVTAYLVTVGTGWEKAVLLLMGGVGDVGLYAPVLYVMSAVEVLPNAIATYVYPKISYRFGQGKDASSLWRPIWLQSVLSVATAVPVAVVLWFLLPVLVTALLPRYTASIPAMQIVAVAGIFSSLKLASNLLRSVGAWGLLLAYGLGFLVIRGACLYGFAQFHEPLIGVAWGALVAAVLVAAYALGLARWSLRQASGGTTA